MDQDSDNAATPQRRSDVSSAERQPEQAIEPLPSWLQPGNPESRWPIFIALIAAMAFQLAVHPRYAVAPRWPLITMEALLLIGLAIINPNHSTRPSQLAQTISLVLLGAITLDNAASAFVLDYRIINGDVSNDASVLLGSGAAIFLTNIIAFGIWYSELDLGGPFKRGAGHTVGKRRTPDFMFPQTEKGHLAATNWKPQFVDYLYVSFTNVVAFSPTDTMPLTHRAKALMTLQSLVAVSTLALVIARAVNVLK